jgi:hypothetical protein
MEPPHDYSSSPRIERIVNDAVLSRQYRSVEDVLSEAIAVWQARQTALAEPTEDERQAAIERLNSFSRTHQPSLARHDYQATPRRGASVSWIVLDASVTLACCFPDEQTPSSACMRHPRRGDTLATHWLDPFLFK